MTRHPIRLATMALLLWEGRALTAADCADLFDVSLRTAQRDLADVEQIVPVIVKVGRHLGAHRGQQPTRIEGMGKARVLGVTR